MSVSATRDKNRKNCPTLLVKRYFLWTVNGPLRRVNDSLSTWPYISHRACGHIRLHAATLQLIGWQSEMEGCAGTAIRGGP
jgi:hypothetical protein